MSECDVQGWINYMLKRICDERKAQDLSQMELAEKADLTCNTICRIENGKGDPRISNVLRIADALHTPIFPQEERKKNADGQENEDKQWQEITTLWRGIPEENKEIVYVMLKGLLTPIQLTEGNKADGAKST